MKRLNKMNIGVLLLLLIYIGQSLFTCVSAMPSTSTDPAMNTSHCHGHSESMAVDSDADLEVESRCCKGECSMLNCHNTSITLDSINFPSALLIVAGDFPELSISPVRTASSFYRPPIRG